MNTVIKRTIKVKFLFILILSNATVFLLSLEAPPSIKLQSQTTRLNYIPIKISGNLRTVLNKSYPVQIVSGNQIHKNVFILKEYEIQKNILNDSHPRQEYLIHIHKKEANLIKKNSTYDILPLSIDVSKKIKKRAYEIYF